MSPKKDAIVPASGALPERPDGSAFHAQPYKHAAAGPGAVLSTLRYAAETSGAVRAAKSLLAVNQADGFDCSGCAWPDPDADHRGMFEFCENGARAVLHEADKRSVDASFFATHSVSALREMSDHALEHQGRLAQPMVKRAGVDHYEPIEWDAALDLVATELRALASPAEAAFYTSGRTSNEAAFLYQLFARSFGTNNLPDCSNMCHESSGKGLGNTLGIGKGTVTLADFDKADLIFIVGQNPGTNHPRMLTTLVDAARRGAKIVSINPLRERGLESFAHPQRPLGALGIGQRVSTHYVQLKINGDVALLKGVMKEILALERERGNVIDHSFIEEHTQGFADLRAALESVTYDELEASSGIARSTMRELAELYANAERTIVCWAMGLTQHKNGVANVREIVNLLLLRGNVGKPGAGACPVRGHSNVQGDRTVGIHEAPTEAFLEKLDAGTGIRSPRAHGLDVVGTIQALEDGAVKVFFSMGGNFAAATPDTARTARALGRAKLTVSVATKLNRSHLEIGETSLILPCLARSEVDLTGGTEQFVTVENSMGIVHASRGTLQPTSHDLRSETAIVAAIAKRTLGDSTPIDWDGLAASYDEIRALIERSIAGFDQYNERVRVKGGFYLPNGPRERRFTTKSGKAAFTVQALPKLDVRQGELVLMTIRSHDQFNTTIYTENDRYRGIYGERRVVLMHEADMRERGLSEGQRIDVTSRHEGTERSVKAFLAVPYDIPRGCAAAYFPEANPLVPLEHFADESRTPASKSIVVRISPSAA